MKQTTILIAAVSLSVALRAGANVDFTKDIKPLLEQNCVKCHGPEKQKSKFRLDTQELLMKGGKGGLALVAGKSADSELYKRITLPKGHDDIMPSEGEPLTKAQTDLIKAWIDEGVNWPAGLVLGGSAPSASVTNIVVSTPVTNMVVRTNFVMMTNVVVVTNLVVTTNMVFTTNMIVIKPPPPPGPKLPDNFKPGPNEATAIAAIAKSGVDVRPVAMNTVWREANFRLQSTNISDASIASLKDLPTLVDLNLATTKITDAGLASVKDLPYLMRLNLALTAVSDAGLPNLTGLTNLVYLNLYGTQVSDAGLDQLKGLKHLRNLYVWQSKVTEEGANKLRTTLPFLEISTGAELKVIAKAEPKKEDKPAPKKEDKPAAKKDDKPAAKTDAPAKKDEPKKEEPKKDAVKPAEAKPAEAKPADKKDDKK